MELNMPRSSLRLHAAALALALAAPAAHAATVTVNLDLLSLDNYAVIEEVAPGYGSDGPVTVNWNPFDSFDKRLLYWNDNYSGRDAAWCRDGINSYCALDLTVASGYTLTLDRFWLGGWPNTDRKITWSVIDLFDNTTVAGLVNALVNGTPGTGLTNVINRTSTAGFRILFGPDGYDGGINDIVYTYARVDTPPPPPPQPGVVPLPAAGWLLLAGLGGLVALRRRT
jgi:hypothetical protein